MKATGTFEVELAPLESHVEGSGDTTLGRLSIDKTFHGDLDATSQGEMLTATAATQGAAGYVALEQVEGTLAGRQGTFVLLHFGTMHEGTNRLRLEVSPGSGSGELQGLHGSMIIHIDEGKHSYELEYELP